MYSVRPLPLFGKLVRLRSVTATALGIALIAVVSLAAQFQTPAAAALLALLFYLLPAGVGTALLPSASIMARMGLRKSEHVLLAYFVGLIAVSLAAVARERNTSPEMRALIDPAMLDYALLGVAALGWTRIVSQWRGLYAMEDFVRVALWCSPLFVVPYALAYLVFSRYPLTDLFQFTHIMKGAEEFAAFDRLNPFTADSYAPVIQPILGSLLRLTGANSLDAMWLLPFPAYLFRVAVLYALGRRLLGNRDSVAIFAAISLPFFGLGVLTNGDLAALGALLVMSLTLALMPDARRSVEPSAAMSWFAAAGTVVALVVSLLCARFLPDWAMLSLVLAIIVAIFACAQRAAAFAPFLTLCLATAVIAPLHRSSVLLVPAVAASLAWARAPLMSRSSLFWLSALLAVASVLLTASVLLNHFGLLALPDPGIALTRLIDTILGLNYSQSQDAMLGTGSKVALFEITRSVGPLIALWSLLLAAYCFTRKTAEENKCGLALRCDATWMAACALLALLLLGLPFAYRAVFIPVVLLAALIAHHLWQLQARGLAQAAVGVICFVLLIATAEYAVPEASAVAQYYVNRAMPALLLCLLPVVGTAIALLAKPYWARPAVILLIVWAVLFEKQVIRYHFFHYTFPGEPPPPTEPLSHYTVQDVKLAEWIRDNYGDGILISDPYTLAITRALTGLNSVVTFSNLDTMDERAADELRSYLRDILQAGEASSTERNCGEWHAAARLLGFGVSSESNYMLFQSANPSVFGRDVLQVFGYRSGLLLMAGEDSREATVAEGRHAWLMGGFVPGPGSAASSATPVRRSERKPHALTIINGRTIEWAFGTFAAQRHDGGDSWESGGRMRDALVVQCHAIIGPGHSLILAQPLGGK